MKIKNKNVEIRDRIRELRRVSAKDLRANPKNWRKHPDYQKRAMQGIFQEVGIADAAIGYESEDGQITLIDGHLRADIMGDDLIPVLILDVNETEADKLLAALDPLAGMAETDFGKLEELVRSFETDDEALREFYAELAGMEAELDEQLGEDLEDYDDMLDADEDEDADDDVDEDDEESSETYLNQEDVPDILWPSDNDFGVPTLDINKQVKLLEAPVRMWGDAARASKMYGTYLFYIEDYKFASLWADPMPVVDSRCKAAGEINYSTADELPRALVLYNVYKKRWLARFWQSKGVDIIVDVNVQDHFQDDNLLGVPHGWRAYCTRGYNAWKGGLELQYEKCKERAGTDDILFVVYGGGREVQEMAQRYNWVFIPERMHQVTGRASME